MVPKHSLLKYFTLTFTRHKSSKFEGSGPPITASKNRDDKHEYRLERYRKDGK